MSDDLEGLRGALRILRTQEGDALREATELRERGAPPKDVQAKTSEAERLRARANAVVRELEERQLH